MEKCEMKKVLIISPHPLFRDMTLNYIKKKLYKIEI